MKLSGRGASIENTAQAGIVAWFRVSGVFSSSSSFLWSFDLFHGLLCILFIQYITLILVIYNGLQFILSCT